MALRKRSNVWYVDIYAPDGKRIQRSTGTSGKEAAQEYHDRLKHDLWRQSRLDEKPRRKWKEAVVRFLKEKEDKLSLRSDITRLRWWDQHLGDFYLDQITGDTIQKFGWEKVQESSKATANRHLAVVRTIFRMAANQWGWIDKPPYIQLFQESKRRIRWLTEEEAERLCSELPPHLVAMVKFTLATGLRESNVVGLQWSQLNLNRATAWIHHDEVKNKRPLAVPLNEEAIQVVRSQIGKNLQYVFTYRGDSVGRANNGAWRKALKRAGIKNFRWHDLRHTWASWHVQRGTPLNVLQELGGWETMDMVRRYAHFGGHHLAEHASRVVTKWGQEQFEQEKRA
jgi:integrase